MSVISPTIVVIFIPVHDSAWPINDGILQYAAHISKDLTGPQYFAA